MSNQTVIETSVWLKGIFTCLLIEYIFSDDQWQETLERVIYHFINWFHFLPDLIIIMKGFKLQVYIYFFFHKNQIWLNLSCDFLTEISLKLWLSITNEKSYMNVFPLSYSGFMIISQNYEWGILSHVFLVSTKISLGVSFFSKNWAETKT